MTGRIHLGHRVGPAVHGHPVEVRPGQRYWPRFGRKRERLTVRSIARKGFAVCVRESGTVVRVKLARLLERREDGEGRHYRWVGWAPRRSGYRTRARVVAVDDGAAMLELPEWGRGVPAGLFLELVPREARRAGAEVDLRADLGATSAGALNMHGLVGVGRGGAR